MSTAAPASTSARGAAHAGGAAHAEPHDDHAPPPPPPDCGVPREHRKAIVVGASSGIGAAITKQLVHEGYRVAAIASNAGKLQSLAEECAPLARSNGGAMSTHVHDVRDYARAPELFELAARELDGVYLLVYAAAVMPAVGRDEYDTEKDLDQVAVNLSGCIAWCNAAAPLFHTQRAGTIVGISSIAGDRGRKGNPAYNTTKAAMNTFLEALRNRLAERGVRVCTIKPGFVDTAMTRGKEGMFWLISAEEAARQILVAARSGANVRYVPRRWWLVSTVIRSIPSFIFRHLNV